MQLILIACFAPIKEAYAKPSTHCVENEKVVFSCAFKNRKTASLCASQKLSITEGLLQYRIGFIGKKLEMIFPESSAHPAINFAMYSSQGARWRDRLIGFNKNEFSYYIKAYSNSNIPEEEFSISIMRNGILIGELLCLEQSVVDETYLLENIGIPQKISAKIGSSDEK